MIKEAGKPPPTYEIDGEEVALSQGAEGAKALSDFRGRSEEVHGDIRSGDVLVPEHPDARLLSVDSRGGSSQKVQDLHFPSLLVWRI